MATAPLLGQTAALVPARPALEAIDTRELVRMLREQDRQIQELEAECRELAERLVAFQAEILKWVELDR
ncbi:MAG TPA: hypothetical protein VGM69_03570 [Chloroflexota bacterium]|jgi:carbamoylphosphate synthase small subunit